MSSNIKNIRNLLNGHHNILNDKEIETLKDEVNKNLEMTSELNCTLSSPKEVLSVFKKDGGYFENCIINCDIRLDRLHINANFYFHNCHFTGRISGIDTKFDNEILCDDCCFYSLVKLSYVTFHKSLKITRSLFKRNNIWNNAKFEDDVSFNDTFFEGETSFKESHFKSIASFQSVELRNATNFWSSTFNGDFYLTNSIVLNYLNFNDSSFLGQRALFKDSRFGENENSNRTVFFQDANFKGETDFTNTVFLSGVDFFKAQFEKLKFNNANIKIFGGFAHTVFNAEASFSDAVFEGVININNSTIKNSIYFNNCTFSLKLNAWNISVMKDISFKWANFQQKATLSSLSVKNGNANFYGANFGGNAYFYDSEIKHLELTKSVIDKGVFFLDANIKNTNRETWRIIKHQFLKQDNRIEALNYHAKEMQAYHNELSAKKWHNGDRIILYLNQLTNNYGLSWGKGFKFILKTGIPLFVLFWISLSTKPVIFNLDTTFWHTIDSIGLMLGYFFNFLNPTHSLSFMREYQGHWSLFLDILGRVIIGLGIYQTIQAFRKYGRF